MQHVALALLALVSFPSDALAQEAVDAPPAARGGYLVVEVALDSASPEHLVFQDVGRQVAAFHGGRSVAFDGADWPRWGAILRRELPDEVLFVVPPETLDVPLHRRFLLSSAGLDDDPLPDFTFGYFTARDGEALRALWERTRAVHAEGLRGKTWYDFAVTSGMKSAVYAGSVPELARAAGYTGDSLYVATLDADPEHFAFVDEQFARLSEAAVLEFTGNGDPGGIWLFPGARNLDRTLHWPYDPERVGEDPEGVMPRITAARFAGLGLRSPVVWSGTCHSAATQRVFVEGDIVSTFGRTDVTTLHRLQPDQSLCLAMIDAGAVAYLAPIGANHGMAVSRERDTALARGCTLGEAIKSTYDDVFLAAGGPPALDLPVPGAPHARGEPIMQGGGCNRILIGDPALRPFEPVEHPSECVRVLRVEGGVDVTVEWQAGWHPMAWDMYGGRRGTDWRVVARVPLAADALPPEGAAKWDVTVAAEGHAQPDDGPEPASKPEPPVALPYGFTHATVETWRGERWLHLQANGPRSLVERKGVRAVFRVRSR